MCFSRKFQIWVETVRALDKNFIITYRNIVYQIRQGKSSIHVKVRRGVSLKSRFFYVPYMIAHFHEHPPCPRVLKYPSQFSVRATLDYEPLNSQHDITEFTVYRNDWTIERGGKVFHFTFCYARFLFTRIGGTHVWSWQMIVLRDIGRRYTHKLMEIILSCVVWGLRLWQHNIARNDMIIYAHKWWR